MSVALHGNLRDFGIGEVFQLIGQQRKTGILSVRGERVEVELRFDEGRIVTAAPVGTHEHAALGEMAVRCGLLTRERLAELERERESSLLPLDELLVERGVLTRQQVEQVEDLLSRDTLFDLLRWTEGSFRFVPRPIHHQRDAQALLGAEQVLMDGLRMVDEWRSMEEEIPPETSILRRSGSFDDYRRAHATGKSRDLAEEERVYLLVDGRMPARRVIDLSRLGTFECARILVTLRRAGLIKVVDAPRTTGARPRLPASVGRPRGVLGGVLALAVLAAVVAAAYSTPTPEPRAEVEIVRRPLLAARAVLATRKLRREAEALHFATGAGSGSLASARPSRALAPEEARVYHAMHGGSPMLLAPEH